MSLYPTRWQTAQAHGSSAVSAPFGFRSSESGEAAEAPVSQQLLTWLLFWTMLSLIARHPVYVSGPARTASVYQNGYNMGLARGSHIYLYLHLLLYRILRQSRYLSTHDSSLSQYV